MSFSRRTLSTLACLVWANIQPCVAVAQLNPIGPNDPTLRLSFSQESLIVESGARYLPKGYKPDQLRLIRSLASVIKERWLTCQPRQEATYRAYVQANMYMGAFDISVDSLGATLALRDTLGGPVSATIAHDFEAFGPLALFRVFDQELSSGVRYLQLSTSPSPLRCFSGSSGPVQLTFRTRSDNPDGEYNIRLVMLGPLVVH